MTFIYRWALFLVGVSLTAKALDLFEKKVTSDARLAEAQGDLAFSQARKVDAEKDALPSRHERSAAADDRTDALLAIRAIEREVRTIRASSEETTKQVSALHHHLGHQGGPQHEIDPLKAQVMAQVEKEVTQELEAAKVEAGVRAKLDQATQVADAISQAVDPEPLVAPQALIAEFGLSPEDQKAVEDATNAVLKLVETRKVES